MTRVPTTPQRPSTERGATGGRPARGAPVITVDPVRVLRQNIWLLIGTIVLGCGLGVAAHFAFLNFYPLYLGEVRFLLKAPLRDSMDVLPQDVFNEETVVRLAQTEAARIVSRDNLLAAMRNPDVRNTQWAQRYRDQSGVFDSEAAVDDLIKEVRAGHRRGQQIFFVTWRAHVPTDVPVVLNSVTDTYVDARRREDERRFTQSADVFRQQEQQIDTQITNLKRQMAEFIGQHGLTQGGVEHDERRHGLELSERARASRDRVDRVVGDAEGEGERVLVRVDEQARALLRHDRDDLDVGVRLDEVAQRA